MTQEELAKTRVTQGYIGYLERGLKKNPSLPTLKKAGARPWRANDGATRVRRSQSADEQAKAILAEFANEELPILSGALKLRMGWPGRKIVGGLIEARID